MYGNEEAVGQGIHESIAAGEVQRQDLFIVSKLGNNHHAAAAVLPAVQASLSKLQLDYLDLYHIHWWVADKAVHLKVTMLPCYVHLPDTAVCLSLTVLSASESRRGQPLDELYMSSNALK